MTPDAIPRFDELNEVLAKTTGWKLVGVEGLLPELTFFDHLANRRFPVTWWIRKPEQIDYIAEPDLFHDLFGHVPLLLNPVFADYMQAYGRGGVRAHGIGGEALVNLTRLYWYTVEFGLIRQDDGLRIYGSGIVSARRANRSIAWNRPRRTASASISTRIMRTRYRIDTYQKTYFVIDSFDELMEATRPDFLPIYRGSRPTFDSGRRDPAERSRVPSRHRRRLGERRRRLSRAVRVRVELSPAQASKPRIRSGDEMNRIALALACSLAAIPAAQAEVKSASADGFFITFSGQVAASATKAVHRRDPDPALVDSEHTWSGKASNLSLKPEAGGCFCEKWKDGSVEHGRVIMAMPGKVLRLETALGPLQERALNGMLSFWIRSEDSTTTLTVEYRVNGASASGLDQLAPSVDEVLGAQVDRLRRYIATGNPEPPRGEAPTRTSAPEPRRRPRPAAAKAEAAKPKPQDARTAGSGGQ